LAESFGLPAGANVEGQLAAALRRIGAYRVFDTSFSADLTILEEASELVSRIQNGGSLPLLTSCSPAWVRFVEQFYPEMVPHLSSCKSPQQMMGALCKRVFAPREGLDPEKVVSVSLMPCTAKKLECSRAEHQHQFVPDVDYVLTTRELVQLLRMKGIDLARLEPESADDPWGERTGAGKIFGATGGVMEAALRTAHFLLTGSELADLDVTAVRGVSGLKELKITINGLTIGAAVASGLRNARGLLDEVKAGRSDLHFIEVMSCPGGCIAGGGQPLLDEEAIKTRLEALYRIDRDAPLRTSHANPCVQRLYTEVLGKPLGHKSHELLHTHYCPGAQSR
jgi:NADH-quinone oxidoreductase subunit G/NADP-reducing hydrogenase subunit HndD